MSPSIQLGTIVWAEISDPNGIKKKRPAVVVTPTELIVPGGKLDVVAVTSFVPNPLPSDHILLPWHAQRHPRTGLNRKSAAVCSWVVEIEMGDVENVVGLVPPHIVIQIVARAFGSP